MERKKITDPVRAQAAVAYLIAEGWKIDLEAINKQLPGGLQSQDWLSIANGCMDYCFEVMAKEKVVPIMSYLKH